MSLRRGRNRQQREDREEDHLGSVVRTVGSATLSGYLASAIKKELDAASPRGNTPFLNAIATDIIIALAAPNLIHTSCSLTGCKSGIVKGGA